MEWRIYNSADNSGGVMTKINKLPLISVIMSVYNCKDRNKLEKSIDSILNQTYSNFEFIICDDGSSDNTLDVLNELAQKDTRIKIVSYTKNKGLANALNYCLEFCKGDFIARQDDDDISYPKRFETEIKFLLKYTQFGFVGTIADIYDNDGIWKKYSLSSKPLKKDFLWNSPFIHPSVMFRKEILDSVNGYRVSWETMRAEDYDLFMRLYAEGVRGYNIQKVLYSYYIDRNEKKHRNMKTRIQESIVRYKGFRLLDMGFRSVPYIIKPIILGLIPGKVMLLINKNKYSIN